jgi:uncharacterized membrane protein YgcG
MKAYNSDTIFNASVKQKSEHWLAQKLISEEQYAAISNNYPNQFYTPNVFVKIGLFIFTCFIILAALGIYLLMFAAGLNGSGDGFFIFTSLFFAVACFVALEILIRSKQIYNSGTDEALLYVGLLCICIGLFAIIDTSNEDNPLLLVLLAFPFIGFAAVRYADRIVTLAVCACVYAILFFTILKFGDLAKVIMPFACMLFSAILYFQAKKWKTKLELHYWHSCLVVIEFVALIIFYAACNYYVIRESSVEFFDLQLTYGQDIPLAFLFYILTATVPAAYIYFGLKHKDKTLLWAGLVLLAASALTFKYYFSLGHPEISLTVAGIILTLTAYFCIRYFRQPKHGITFEEDTDANSFLKSNAEALIILEGMAQKTPGNSQDGFEFGGGKSGGAGSGGSY